MGMDTSGVYWSRKLSRSRGCGFGSEPGTSGLRAFMATALSRIRMLCSSTCFVTARAFSMTSLLGNIPSGWGVVSSSFRIGRLRCFVRRLSSDEWLALLASSDFCSSSTYPPSGKNDATIARIATTPQITLTMFFLTSSMLPLSSHSHGRESVVRFGATRDSFPALRRRGGSRRGGRRVRVGSRVCRRGRRGIEHHGEDDRELRIVAHVLVEEKPVPERPRVLQ